MFSPELSDNLVTFQLGKTSDLHAMLNCKELLTAICESVEGDQAAPSCEEIRRHLDGCPECRQVYENLRHTVDLCREGLKEPIPGESGADGAAQQVATNKEELRKRLCQMLREKWKQ
jgi:predicted anti-sigma-YlaC factor YlaD